MSEGIKKNIYEVFQESINGKCKIRKQKDCERKEEKFLKKKKKGKKIF